MNNQEDKLTKAQHDICYEIQFELIRGIMKISHDKIWDMITKAMIDEAGVRIPKEAADEAQRKD